MERALYIHIPFCVRKCLYCDFYSISDLSLQDDYIDALISEIKRIEDKKLKSIFIGGGTPTVLSKNNLQKLLNKLLRFECKEFTIEANPGTLNKEKLMMFKEYGVNRLSIGLQATQDRILKKLGRIHRYDDFLRNFELSRKVGFDNINIDLMFDIPGQKFEDWMKTLTEIVSLKPEHISAYSLIIEEGTFFYELYQRGELDIEDEEIDRMMYHFVIDFLKENGYKHYEISNFALDGHECIHNLTYWNVEEYYGVGVSAHSFINNYRFSNVNDIKEYINNVKTEKKVCEKVYISKEEEMHEFMLLGLRKIDGVSKNIFKERFKKDINEVFGNKLIKLKKNGLILDDDNFIKLSSKGLDLANQVLMEFLS